MGAPYARVSRGPRIDRHPLIIELVYVPGRYTDEPNHLKAACKPQPSCKANEHIVGASSIARGSCVTSTATTASVAVDAATVTPATPGNGTAGAGAEAAEAAEATEATEAAPPPPPPPPLVAGISSNSTDPGPAASTIGDSSSRAGVNRSSPLGADTGLGAAATAAGGANSSGAAGYTHPSLDADSDTNSGGGGGGGGDGGATVAAVVVVLLLLACGALGAVFFVKQRKAPPPASVPEVSTQTVHNAAFDDGQHANAAHNPSTGDGGSCGADDVYETGHAVGGAGVGEAGGDDTYTGYEASAGGHGRGGTAGTDAYAGYETSRAGVQDGTGTDTYTALPLTRAGHEDGSARVPGDMDTYVGYSISAPGSTAVGEHHDDTYSGYAPAATPGVGTHTSTAPPTIARCTHCNAKKAFCVCLVSTSGLKSGPGPTAGVRAAVDGINDGGEGEGEGDEYVTIAGAGGTAWAVPTTVV